ncbi:MAG TPA: hypothetical protein VHS80_05805 [Chthoniobacterales bacterium]|nr:hypothetical protein [Chthoniobacterales bacterium]
MSVIKLFLAIDDALVVLPIESHHVRCEMGLTDNDVGCVAVDPFRPEFVYCGTFGSGLWRSDDAGAHWQPVGRGIRHSKIQSVTVSRSERENGRGIVYAGTEPSAIFRSEDGGANWRECGDLTALPSASEWSFPPRPETHHVRWIAPDPHFPGRLFAAIEAGALIRSPDSGITWQDRTTDGPRDTHQLLIHHSVPGRLYSAAGDGYFESTDGGDTWQRFGEGLRHRYLWSIAVDSADPDNIIVSAAASARHSHADPAESYLYRRVNGSPWQELRDGLPEPVGRRTAVLSAHPSEPGTFFAAWENEVFCSADGGASWRSLNVPWAKNYRVNELCALTVAETD